ncbi:MAG: hypothetical protein WC509_09050 [Candidatus Izemoplasmatales bacterium]
MRIVYRTKQDERLCCDFAYARRRLGDDVAKRLMKAIDFAEAADALADFVHVPQFRFHPLKHTETHRFAIDLVKTSGMRLLLTALDGDGRPVVKETALDVLLVECDFAVAEVSNHYEE